MKFILFIILSIGTSVVQAQQINCDSLIKQFDDAIAAAKSQKVDAATLQQLAATKKQFIELYCKEGSVKSTSSKSESTNTTNTPKISNSTSNVSYAMAYKIDLSVESKGADGTVKSNFDYWLNKEGNKMFIDKESIKKAQASIAAEVDGTANFDGWYIEHTGKSIMYTITDEGEKFAFAQQLIKKLPIDKNHKLTIKATNQSKKIAGYDCVSYSITGNADGEQVNLTCWVTKTVLPFYHNSFPMLSMFSAGAMGISGLPNRGVLLIQGKSGADNIVIEVKKIQPSIKSFTLVGYKNISY